MIKRKVEGMILKSGDEPCRVPLTAEFIYDPDDPWAVEIVFEYTDGNGQNVIVWTVGRDLLMHGIASTAVCGLGEFRLRYSVVHARVIACLKSDGGHADVGLDQQQILDFLNDTTDAVQFGDECMDAAIDKAIEELLNS